MISIHSVAHVRVTNEGTYYGDYLYSEIEWIDLKVQGVETNGYTLDMKYYIGNIDRRFCTFYEIE